MTADTALTIARAAIAEAGPFTSAVLGFSPSGFGLVIDGRMVADGLVSGDAIDVAMLVDTLRHDLRERGVEPTLEHAPGDGSVRRVTRELF